MSNWGDILYPGNPDRREKVNEKIISIKAQLGTMRDNTNAAVEVANNTLSFNDISTVITTLPKEDITNAKAFLESIEKKFEEIDTAMSPLETKIKMKYPEKFAKIKDVLKDTDLTFTERLKKLKKDSFTGDVTTVSIVFTAVSGLIVKTLAQITTKAVASFAGAIGGALIGLVVDIIWGAVQGAEERSELEKAIKQLTEADEALQNNTDCVIGVVSNMKTAQAVLPNNKI